MNYFVSVESPAWSHEIDKQKTYNEECSERKLSMKCPQMKRQTFVEHNNIVITGWEIKSKCVASKIKCLRELDEAKVFEEFLGLGQHKGFGVWQYSFHYVTSCKSMFDMIEIRSQTSQQRKKSVILKRIREANFLHFSQCRKDSLQTERGCFRKSEEICMWQKFLLLFLRVNV